MRTKCVPEYNKKEHIHIYVCDGTEIGLIAQDVEQVFPNLVLTDPEGKKLVNYTSLIPVLIDAINTLTAEVNALKKSQRR